MSPRRWTVAQIGAREGYAAARAFAGSGRLRRLYTEVWCRYGAGLLRRGPAACRTLAGRFQADVAADRVTAFTGRVLVHMFARAVGLAPRPPGQFEEFLRVGAWFDELVARRLRRERLEAAA